MEVEIEGDFPDAIVERTELGDDVKKFEVATTNQDNQTP
jgi:hypothetical protein